MLSTVAGRQATLTLQLFKQGKEEIILRNDAERILRDENFLIHAGNHFLYLFLGMTRKTRDDSQRLVSMRLLHYIVNGRHRWKRARFEKMGGSSRRRVLIG